MWSAESKWDQSFWVACAATVALIAAVVPWHIGDAALRWGSGLELGLLIPLALVLAALNWLAGGSWLVALVRLAGTVSPLAGDPPSPPADTE